MSLVYDFYPEDYCDVCCCYRYNGIEYNTGICDPCWEWECDYYWWD